MIVGLICEFIVGEPITVYTKSPLYHYEAYSRRKYNFVAILFSLSSNGGKFKVRSFKIMKVEKEDSVFPRIENSTNKE